MERKSENCLIWGLHGRIKNSILNADCRTKYLFCILCIITLTLFTPDNRIVAQHIKSDSLNMSLSSNPANLSGTNHHFEISKSTINAANFREGFISNPLELLQSKIPGLLITKPGSDPNKDYNLRMRGLSTIFSDSSPLIVIDGIPAFSLNNVDPNDIASITVLKGAKASLFGIRGGAGVIQITTKRNNTTSSQESLSFEYKTQFSTENLYNAPDILSAEEYANITVDPSLPGPLDLGSSTEWYDQITQSAFSYSQHLAVDGHKRNTNYRISLNYKNLDGIQKKTGYNQLNGRAFLSQNLLRKLFNIQLHFAGTRRNANLGFPEAFLFASTFNPTAPTKDPDQSQYGGYFEMDVPGVYNPLSIIEQGYKVGEIKRYSGSIKLNIDMSDLLLEGLNISGKYAFENEHSLLGEVRQKTAKYIGSSTGGYAGKLTNDYYIDYYNVFAAYSSSWEQVDIGIKGGYTHQIFETDFLSRYGEDFPSHDISLDDLTESKASGYNLAGIEDHEGDYYISTLFSNFSFNWNSFFDFSLNLSQEGSSQFSSQNRWDLFWGIKAGFDISRLSRSPFLDKLQLIAGYGVSGNDISVKNNTLTNYPVNQWMTPAPVISDLLNHVEREKVKSQDLGLNFELFESRFSGYLEYYYKTSKKLMYPVILLVPGREIVNSLVNMGKINTQGFEAALNITPVREKSFSWQTNFSLHTYKSELAYLADDFPASTLVPSSALDFSSSPSTRVSILKEGEEVGQLWGPRFAEIGNDGNWYFYSIDGDLITGDEITDDDKIILGNGNPDLEFSFGNSFRYKNWKLDLLLRSIIGHDLINTYRVFYENPSLISLYNQQASIDNVTELVAAPHFSSRYVEDASFVKLDHLTLGYSLSPTNTAIQSISFYLTGTNLFTWTAYSGADPEPHLSDRGPQGSYGGANLLVAGIDRPYNWFSSRTFTLGIDLKF